MEQIPGLLEVLQTLMQGNGGARLAGRAQQHGAAACKTEKPVVLTEKITLNDLMSLSKHFWRASKSVGQYPESQGKGRPIGFYPVRLTTVA